MSSSRGSSERHRLAPVLPCRVPGDIAHRPGPVEGDERDEVLELGRLHEPERLAHPRRLELEHARGVAACEHRVRLRVVERERRDVEPAHEGDRLVDHVEVAEPEEVHLQKAEVHDVVHTDLRHDLLVGALLLERDHLDQRLRTDDDSGRVDGVRPREPLERSREVEDLLRDRVRVDGLAQLGAGLERVLEHLPRPFRDHLGQAVDDAVRDVEHTPGIADGGAGGHCREGDDLRDAVATVLVRDVVDDAVAACDGEVDVHVRQVLARRVQEPLEEQPVAHRIDVGDLEAVGGQRAGGRAAARPDAHPVRLREVDEVPDDEEVVREPHLLHRLQLEAEPLRQLGSRLPVSLQESLLAELDEVVEGVAALRDGERREQDAAELELDVAALGDLERACERRLVPGEVERHLRLRLEEELVRVEAPVVRVLERVPGLDAEERLVRERVARVEVVDVAGCHQREPGLGGERDEVRVDAQLVLDPAVLHLDVHGVAPEELDEAVEVLTCVLPAPLGERLRHATGEAARERDDALRVALEQLPVDARLVVVPLEVAERAELDQVRVPLVRLCEEGQVRVALRLRLAVVRDVDLAPDERLDALLARLPAELDHTRERAVVRERDGRHLEPRCLLHESGDPARAVQDRVLRVDVQVDERDGSARSGGSHGRAIVLPSSDGKSRTSPSRPAARLPRPGGPAQDRGRGSR